MAVPFDLTQAHETERARAQSRISFIHSENQGFERSADRELFFGGGRQLPNLLKIYNDIEPPLSRAASTDQQLRPPHGCIGVASRTIAGFFDEQLGV